MPENGDDPLGGLGSVEIPTLQRTALEAFQDRLLAPVYATAQAVAEGRESEFKEAGDAIKLVCIQGNDSGEVVAAMIVGFFDDECEWMRLADLSAVEPSSDDPSCE